MKRFQGQLRWIEQRKRWRLDWCGKFQGNFHTREEAEAKLKVLKESHQADVRAAEIAKFGDVPLFACRRCKVKKPESAFMEVVAKSTGESRTTEQCIDCIRKSNIYQQKPEQVSKRKEYRDQPHVKEATKKANQKPEGKRQRALLQKLPESKKRRKENPPPSAAPEKVREYSERQRKTPGFIARTTSVQFRLRQSLQAKMRAALQGRLLEHELTKLNVFCPWVDNEADVVEHFSNKLKRGMTMENYGSVWNIAHNIPAAYYDLEDIDDAKRCNSQCNLGCDYAVTGFGEPTNSEKGTKLPSNEAMIEQGVSSWPKAWNGSLPSNVERIKLEMLAHAGKVYPRKHVGQTDIRMFIQEA